jgi:hypothetical protein
MVVNGLQKALITSHIAPRASRLNCQNVFFFKCEYIIFLTILIYFYSEQNNVSQVGIHLHTKKTKKKLKNATIVYA